MLFSKKNLCNFNVLVLREIVTNIFDFFRILVFKYLPVMQFFGMHLFILFFIIFTVIIVLVHSDFAFQIILLFI